MSTNGTKNGIKNCEMEQKMQAGNVPWVSTDFPQLLFPFYLRNKKITFRKLNFLV
jgi:hypothetical protein